MVHVLTAYRRSKDVPLNELAKQVGTSRQSLWRIERGEQRPSPELAAKLAEATGIDARVLLGIAPERLAS